MLDEDKEDSGREKWEWLGGITGGNPHAFTHTIYSQSWLHTYREFLYCIITTHHKSGTCKSFVGPTYKNTVS